MNRHPTPTPPGTQPPKAPRNGTALSWPSPTSTTHPAPRHTTSADRSRRSQPPDPSPWQGREMGREDDGPVAGSEGPCQRQRACRYAQSAAAAREAAAAGADNPGMPGAHRPPGWSGGGGCHRVRGGGQPRRPPLELRRARASEAAPWGLARAPPQHGEGAGAPRDHRGRADAGRAPSSRRQCQRRWGHPAHARGRERHSGTVDRVPR